MARWLSRDGADVILRIWANPGAPRTEIAGEHGDHLRIRIAAPPAGGRANAALCDFVAALFDVPQRCVSLEAGHRGRAKTLRVSAPADLPAALRVFLNGATD